MESTARGRTNRRGANAQTHYEVYQVPTSAFKRVPTLVGATPTILQQNFYHELIEFFFW